MLYWNFEIWNFVRVSPSPEKKNGSNYFKWKWDFGRLGEGLQNFLRGEKGKITVFGNNLVFSKFCICRGYRFSETFKHLKAREKEKVQEGEFLYFLEKSKPIKICLNCKYCLYGCFAFLLDHVTNFTIVFCLYKINPVTMWSKAKRIKVVVGNCSLQMHCNNFS